MGVIGARTAAFDLPEPRASHGPVHLWLRLCRPVSGLWTRTSRNIPPPLVRDRLRLSRHGRLFLSVQTATSLLLAPHVHDCAHPEPSRGPSRSRCDHPLCQQMVMVG